jgi:hypothetical protein
MSGDDRMAIRQYAERRYQYERTPTTALTPQPVIPGFLHALFTDLSPAYAKALGGREDVLYKTDMARAMARGKRKKKAEPEASAVADDDMPLPDAKGPDPDADTDPSLTDEAWQSNAGAVELLLDLGLDPAAKSMHTDGGSALHAAAWQGAADCVVAILRHPGARTLLEVRDPTYHASPLGWCMHGSVNRRNPRGDYVAVARLLLDAGARVDEDVHGRDASDEVRAVIDEAQRAGPVP